MFEKQKQFIDDLKMALFTELQTTVNEFDFVLKDYIINKQLFREGIDGTGKKLPGYVRTTIRLKIRKGDPYDRKTLRDTGEFYASIEITGTPYYIAITSEVEHAKWLVHHYGKDILKITHENFAEFFRVYYIPKLKEYVNNKFTK